MVDPVSRTENPMSPTLLDMGFGEMSYTNISGATLLFEKVKPSLAVSVVSDGPAEKMSENMGAPVPFLELLHKISPLYSAEKIKVEVCPSLEAKMKTESRADKEIAVELNSESFKMLKARAEGEPYVLRRCISCHAQGNFRDAPSIPFDVPSKYERAMQSQAVFSPETLIHEIEMRTGYAAPSNYRMPKGAFGLYPGEQVRLLKYLNGVH